MPKNVSDIFCSKGAIILKTIFVVRDSLQRSIRLTIEVYPAHLINEDSKGSRVLLNSLFDRMRSWVIYVNEIFCYKNRGYAEKERY